RPVRLAPSVGGREPALLPVVQAAGPEGPQRLPHVRSAYGAAQRSAGWLVIARVCIALALALAPASALAGCGGGSGTADVVPNSRRRLDSPRRFPPESAACTPASPALRRGDKRRAVGQARGLVEAVVLDRGADLRVGALRTRARALLASTAGAPGGVLAEAQGERGRPGRHGERDDVALAHRDRAFERELRGLAEVGLQFDRRTLR